MVVTTLLAEFESFEKVCLYLRKISETSTRQGVIAYLRIIQPLFRGINVTDPDTETYERLAEILQMPEMERVKSDDADWLRI